MGSITYDFLADSILFDQNEIDTNFKSLSDNQIENLLVDYRSHCLKNLAELQLEVVNNKSSLKVLSGIEKVNYQMLKQGALYFDQFVIYDPLFEFGHIKNEATNAISQYLGFEQATGIDRPKLVKTVKLLKDITPLIAANYVKILPLSYAFEPPKEIPIHLPINYYADSLPKELLNFCRERAVLKSMKKADIGWLIMDKNDYTPGIYITFKDLDEKFGMMFNYFYQKFEKTETPNKYITTMELANYPMDKKTWDVWTYQSINRTSKAVVDKIYYENMVACDLNATYLTNNSFTADILTQSLGAKETIETAAATQFMNIDLPFLDKIDSGKLMNIREYEADIFTNFRIELERQFRELRNVHDKKEIKLRQENIIHELGVVQVKKINQKFTQLKQKGIVDAVLLIGGLAGTIQTAGWSLLASAIATVSGYKTYREYKDQLKENPSYLLWKTIKK